MVSSDAVEGLCDVSVDIGIDNGCVVVVEVVARGEIGSDWSIDDDGGATSLEILVNGFNVWKSPYDFEKGWLG